MEFIVRGSKDYASTITMFCLTNMIKPPAKAYKQLEMDGYLRVIIDEEYINWLKNNYPEKSLKFIDLLESFGQ